MGNISVMFAGQDFRDGPFYLTNGPGWSAVCRWALSDAAKNYPHLRELVEQGELKGTDQLGLDLAGACVLAPASIRGVLEELAEKVGVGDAEETAIITD